MNFSAVGKGEFLLIAHIISMFLLVALLRPYTSGHFGDITSSLLYSLSVLLVCVDSIDYDKLYIPLVAARMWVILDVAGFFSKEARSGCSDLEAYFGAILLCNLLWLPYTLRLSYWWRLADAAVGCISVVVFVVVVRHHLIIAFTAPTLALVMFETVAIAMNFMGMLSCTVVLSENNAIILAQKIYDSSRQETTNLLRQIHPLYDRKRFCCLLPRRLYNCELLAVHIKAADILTGLLSTTDIWNCMQQFYGVFDECLKSFPMWKVSQFSGISYFILQRNEMWQLDGQRSVDDALSSRVRLSTVLRTMQQCMARYNDANSMHASASIAVLRGPLTLGMLGDARCTFDCYGPTRDMGYVMMMAEDDGICVTDSIASRIKRELRYTSKKVATFQRYRGRALVDSCQRLQFGVGAFSGMKLEDFEHIHMLGRGGYGSVHLARDKLSGEEFAIKVIPRSRGKHSSKLLRRELLILQRLDHPNVVHMKYCIIERDRTYLVMPYIRGGNLKEIVEHIEHDLSTLQGWFAELALALECEQNIFYIAFL